MITRRDFIGAGALASWLPPLSAAERARGILVNDIHSQLTATRVNRVVVAATLDAVRDAINAARQERRAVCIAGGRHAMGAQAFATDGILIDIRKLDRVLGFDRQRGLIEVESGIQWPALLSYLTSTQDGRGTLFYRGGKLLRDR